MFPLVKMPAAWLKSISDGKFSICLSSRCLTCVHKHHNSLVQKRFNGTYLEVLGYKRKTTTFLKFSCMYKRRT